MTILEAVAEAGVVLKKVASTRGGEYAGPCPGCGGRDRFRVWPEGRGGEGSFWCRQCGKGGDLVQFLVDFCGMEYRDAFKAAGREAPFNPGVRSSREHEAGNTQGPRSFVPRHYEGPVETWRIKAEQLVSWAHERLLENPVELERLEHRGIDRDAVRMFRLGWLPGEKGKNAMFRPKESWGLPTVTDENGKKKMLWIPRGLVIPYLAGNSVYRIRIRRPGEDLKSDRDVRYYVLPGSGMDAMVLYPDRKGFVLVESELDAIMLARKAGAVVGVIAMGSAMTKPGDSLYYHLRQALRILVSLDFDGAGAKAWRWWQSEFSQSRRWPTPAGKDPGEAFAQGVNILEWVMKGLPPAMTLKYKDAMGGHAPVEGLPVDQDPVVPSKFYSPGVAELKQLLDRYPFKVRATRDRTSLIWDPSWRNEPVQKRISYLTFFDVEVGEYLDAHPADIIHRGNFDFPESEEVIDGRI